MQGRCRAAAGSVPGRCRVGTVSLRGGRPCGNRPEAGSAPPAAAAEPDPRAAASHRPARISAESRIGVQLVRGTQDSRERRSPGETSRRCTVTVTS